MQPTNDNGKQDKDIEIMVATTADDLDETFNRQQPLHVVFQRALKLVGGQGQPDQFALEYNHQPLDLDRKIGDLAEEFGWVSASSSSWCQSRWSSRWTGARPRWPRRPR